MAKKKNSKFKGETRTSFMFPELHQDVVKAVPQEIDSIWFRESNDDEESNNEYSTHVMGRFNCRNSACPKGGWGSKKVAILIKGYAENGYNAEVFNQRCKSCDQLGTFILDEKSYVDRVAYRIKKWAGVPMERPYYTAKDGKPHRSDLCEGCKEGICQQRDAWEYD